MTPTPEALLDSAHEVVLALVDLQGRLQGVRLSAEYFRDEVLASGYGACMYLLATDVEMETGPGYAIDAERGGFGDFLLRPDLVTLRPLPWDEGAVLVLGDPVSADGTPIAVAPRQVLKDQLDRLATLGLHARVGTELEFLVFTESYRQAYELGYHGLHPATRYNSDYALTGLGDLAGVVRSITRAMAAAGLAVESARGECHPGQYEIVFRHAEALAACDGHVFYKTAAKQLAEAAGVALTFMPKYDDAGEGNSCHVHLSLRDNRGVPVFAGEGPQQERESRSTTLSTRRGSGPQAGMSPLMSQFVAGQLACLREFTLAFAPTVNAYKRLRPGCFAPTGVGWGRDDRTCPVRVIGSGASLRIEHRVAGGDANPYLAVAAIIAAGLHGIEHGLPLPPPGVQRDAALPGDLAEARRLWRSSTAAHKAFGEEVIEHYARAAQAELDAFAGAVTDWERRRGFERL